MRTTNRAARLLATAPLIALCLVQETHAATIDVDTTVDAIDSAGDCSLREAILAANGNKVVDGCAAGEPAGVAVDLVRLPGGVYTLTLEGIDETWIEGKEGGWVAEESPDPAVGDLDVLESLVVIGADPEPPGSRFHTLPGPRGSSTVIRWDAPVGDRIFHASPALGDVTLEVVGVTLRGGFVDATVINPGAPYEEQWLHRRVGGGIAAGPGAVVALRESGGPSDDGGGGSDEDHEEEETEAGDATLVLDDVVVESSYAEGGGGGVWVSGTLDASRLRLQHNATDANGGGLYFEGALSLRDSVLHDNTAEGGGGLFTTGGTAGTILNTVIADNYATGGGGMSVRSLVVLDLVGTTFVGNEAFDVGGGAISNGTLRLDNCTVYGNVAGGGAGLQSFAGGEFVLADTLIGGNTIGVGAVSNCGCTGSGCLVADYFTSTGHNLEDTPTCNLVHADDLVGVDPAVVVVTDAAGTSFVVPRPESPAVDATDACPRFDARGVRRPLDGDHDLDPRCDIGAAELHRLEVDHDADGWCEGLATDFGTLCLEGRSGDCDDTSAGVNPGVAERFDNGVDDDCNGLIDKDDPAYEGCASTPGAPPWLGGLAGLLLLVRRRR